MNFFILIPQQEESLINEDFKQFTYWGSDFNQTVHKFDFEELQRDKKTLLGELQSFQNQISNSTQIKQAVLQSRLRFFENF